MTGSGWVQEFRAVSETRFHGFALMREQSLTGKHTPVCRRFTIFYGLPVQCDSDWMESIVNDGFSLNAEEVQISIFLQHDLENVASAPNLNKSLRSFA
jgi:hypothetical protein